ncbi:MAG: hypothetical protein ABI652_07405, partial [Acidobacteriota bacterium]
MSETRFAITNRGAAIGAIALLLAGAGATYLIMRSPPVEQMAGVQAPAAVSRPSLPPDDAPLSDLVVPLSAEAVQRAGIVVVPVSSASRATSIHLPGVVEPNA